MIQYHKIQTVFKRDPENKFKTLLEGDYSLPVFDYLKNNTWVFTEKVDGTNIRVMFDGERLKFAGKSDNAQIQLPLSERLSERFLPQLDRFIKLFRENDVCLYGEGYGAKIQKGGGNYRSDQDFVLFDVNINGKWLERVDVEDIGKKLSLDVVPIVGEGTLLHMVENAKKGIKSTWGDFQSEGYVARPATELKDSNGNRIITKIKCTDFKKG